MKVRFIGYVFAAVMAAACGGGKSGNGTYLAADVLADTLETEDSSRYSFEVVDEEQQLPANADMLFDDFVFVFIQSKAVQLQRVHFPFPMVEGEDTVWVSRKDWQHENLYLNQDVYTVFYDDVSKMDLEKSVGLEHVDVEHFLPGEELYDTYHFEKENGKWYMVEKDRRPVSESPLASFMAFYRRFSTDSLYSYQHIADVLECSIYDPENESGRISGSIDKSQWSAFCPVLPVEHITNVRYGQTYDRPDKMLMVVRGVANGLSDILTFKRRKGEWMLVAYEN